MKNIKKTPIAFIIFNRPDLTKFVFEKIKIYQPDDLLVISDGPRTKDENHLCIKSREYVENNIDWKCNLMKNYSDTNLGCKRRVSSGLDWVFKNFEKAIILEDDCVPDISFFYFCHELLEKYENDQEVSIISGDNFLFNKYNFDASYYFSRDLHIWGWATWRRFWKKYSVNAKYWPEIQDKKILEKLFKNKSQVDKWKNIFEKIYNNQIDTWDYQLSMTSWFHDMKAIMPNKNLITNIGFRKDATHTTNYSFIANMRTKKMKFPLIHPKSLEIDLVADLIKEKNLNSLNKQNIIIRVYRNLIYGLQNLFRKS